MAKNNREINLYHSYLLKSANKDKPKKTNGAVSYMVLGGIVTVLILGTWYTISALDVLSLQMDYDDINDRLSDQTLIDDAAEADILQMINDNLTSTRAGLDAFKSNVDVSGQYSYLTTDFNTAVSNAFSGKATIGTYSFDNGTFIYEMTSKEAINVSEAVQKLRATEIFSDIEYTSFSSDGEAGEYAFTLTCIAAETAEEVSQ